MPKPKIIEPAALALFRAASQEPIVFQDSSRRKMERTRWKLITQRLAMREQGHVETPISESVEIGSVRPVYAPESPEPLFGFTVQPRTANELSQMVRRAGVDVPDGPLGPTRGGQAGPGERVSTQLLSDSLSDVLDSLAAEQPARSPNAATDATDAALAALREREGGVGSDGS